MNSFVAVLALAMVAYANAGVIAGPTLLSAPGIYGAPIGLRTIGAPILAAPGPIIAGPTLLSAPAAIGVKSIAAPTLLAAPAPIIAGPTLLSAPSASIGVKSVATPVIYG